MANALLRPGVPTSSRKVGRSVVSSNSTDAFSIPGCVYGIAFSSFSACRSVSIGWKVDTRVSLTGVSALFAVAFADFILDCCLV